MNEIRFRNFYANFVIVAMLLCVFAVSFVIAYPTDNVVEQVNNAIYNGNKDSGKVALTFNVYERTDNVEKIADILSQYGVKATFFVGGSWCAKNGNTLLKLASAGFEIGNHGYSHRDHAKLNLSANMDEIRMAERMIDSNLSTLPGYTNSKLFAPPSGSMSNAMFEACDTLDYKVIMWSKDTIDWRDHDEELIYTRATKDLKSGDIILMHPTDATVSALPKILDYIISNGLYADTVSNVIDG